MSLPKTPEILEQLELEVAENHGSIVRAAHALGCKPSEIRLWMLAEPEVAARIRTAMLIGHASLEDVAIERAVHGISRDVYYQGTVVGQEQQYSDGLLQTLLKARVSEYSQEESTLKALTVNVAIMPRASSYEEWVIQRDQSLLPKPDVQLPDPNVEEAQYVELTHTTGLRDVL